MKAILYARTSSEETSEDAKSNGKGKISIEEQLKACRQLAESQGYEIVGEHMDRDTSGRLYWPDCGHIATDRIVAAYIQGRKLPPRKQYRRSLGRLIASLPEADVVVVRDQTRLSRCLLNSSLNDAIWQEFHLCGVVLHSCEEGIIRPDNHEEQLISQIKANVTDKAVKMKAAQCRVSLAEKRDRGMLTASPGFYGYKSAGNQQVEPVPEELDIVKRVFSLILDGQGVVTIVQTFNNEGIPTKRKRMGDEVKGRWYYQTIKHMLRRPEYAGYRYNNSGELIVCKPFAPHAAVSLEDWQKVQTLRSKTARYTKVVGKIHPLSGLLHCEHCKAALKTAHSKVASSGQKLVYYQCYEAALKGAKNSSTECRRARIRERNPITVEEVTTTDPKTKKTKTQNMQQVYVTPVLRQSTFRLQDFSTLEKVGLLESLMPLSILAALQHWHEQHTDNDLVAARDAIQEDLASIHQKREEVQDQFADGTMDLEDAKLLLGATRKREEKLQKELALRTAEIQAHESAPIKAYDLQLILALAAESGYKHLSTLRQLLHKSVARVEVSPNHVDVQLATGQSFQIERVTVRNSRAMPKPLVLIDTDTITEKTTFRIVYLYKSAIADDDTTTRTLCEIGNLTIEAMGTNPKAYANTHTAKAAQSKHLPEEVTAVPTE